MLLQIFDKALNETTFTELYTELCAKMNANLSEFEDPDSEEAKKITFRRVLLDKCQASTVHPGTLYPGNCLTLPCICQYGYDAMAHRPAQSGFEACTWMWIPIRVDSDMYGTMVVAYSPHLLGLVLCPKSWVRVFSLMFPKS